jgi:hypothetical protein
MSLHTALKFLAEEELSFSSRFSYGYEYYSSKTGKKKRVALLDDGFKDYRPSEKQIRRVLKRCVPGFQ